MSEGIFGDSEQTDPQKNKDELKVPACLTFFDKWRSCASSSNQFHHYYIYGKFKDCSVYKDDMQNCILYKTTKSGPAKQSLIEALDRDKINFTSGSVWDKRENPSEYWNKKS